MSATAHSILIPHTSTPPTMVSRPVSSALVVRNLEPHHNEEAVEAIFKGSRGLSRSEVLIKGDQTIAMLYFQVSWHK
jgi:hypothetical protein